MATYIPNAYDATQPTEDKSVESAALEFRTVKVELIKIDAVYGGMADVTTVANDLNAPVSNIETVAIDIVNVNLVGTNIAAVVAVNANAANISTVAADSANIATVTANVPAINTVATNISDVTNFANVYVGPAAADPATRTDTTALQAGDLYFNTVANELRVYNGAFWVEGATDATLLVSKTAPTGSVIGTAGTTAQRDLTPAVGFTRFNTTLNSPEVWNGTEWAPMGGGATGAPGNYVFVENDQTVTGSYTLTAGKNAMSAGPIVINNGVVVTIPTGATWSII